MLYTSTRGKTGLVSSAHAITRGLADDGGLFVPQYIPGIAAAEIKSMIDKSYAERAVTILKQYLTDFMDSELNESVLAAYAENKFGKEPVPLAQINENTGVLELWHGPTSAFKDMALQLLPQLLTRAIVKTGERHKIVILVATSGDTGKAALEGFADVAGTQIIVFYPSEGVSAIQKKQMVSQKGANVKVFGIKGNFDDAQKGVKDILGNTALGNELGKNGYAFSSANSINWGRLVPQIVYYFSAYVDAVRHGKIAFGDKVNFVVPTGNFGDILAGYYARYMGLPVDRLLCASNSNNVLTDFINTGTYDKRRKFYKTISPSMDILISSNLERLLYIVTENDAKQVADYMERLRTEGVYQVNTKTLKRIQSDFFAAWVDELETKEAIGRVYAKYNYLMDTHTAVAWRAMEKYRFLTGDETYTIVLSTASPYKFPDSVITAIGGIDAVIDREDPFAMLHALHEITGKPVPTRMLELEEAEVLHHEVVTPDKMELAVVKNLVS